MTKALRYIIEHAATPGILLMISMIAALVVSNSPAAGWYESLLVTKAEVGYGEFQITKPVLLWINDGLMALFFLLVGLELKREILLGELSHPKKVVLPLLAAIGGIAAPVAIYIALNKGDELAMRGWAIPAATDIAFALGVLALLGSKVPLSLKVFLTSIAVLDDLAAIAIIAVFYTEKLSLLSLGVGGGVLVLLLILNRIRVRNLFPYLVLGLILWIAVLKSGVHATLAGVALAIFLPSARRGAPEEKSPLNTLEHALMPWVGFLILPIFAFANAGVSLKGLTLDSLLSPIPLGIAAGLFFGKQIGIFLTSWLAVTIRVAKLPEGVTWFQLYGMAVLCGIGFTMSLFISSLAFDESNPAVHALDNRLGILTGSLLSAVVGVILLSLSKAPPKTSGE